MYLWYLYLSYSVYIDKQRLKLYKKIIYLLKLYIYYENYGGQELSYE